MAPLEPLPENYTDRYFVDLATAADQYEIQCRTQSDIDVLTFDVQMGGILTAMSTLMPQTFVQAVRFQPAGSSLSWPVESSLTGNEYGTGTATEENVPRFLSFQGRTNTGRRVSWFLFGTAVAFPPTYRIQAASNANVNAVIAAKALAPDIFIAIDGADANWYAYANCGFNSYKERRQRRA